MAESSPNKKHSPTKAKLSTKTPSVSDTSGPATDAGMTMATSRIDNEGDEAADYQIVAAIDFGTTFSGYAYSFASNKQAIHVNKNWGQTQGEFNSLIPPFLTSSAPSSCLNEVIASIYSLISS